MATMSTAKKKGLGRGLEALLGGPAEIVETSKQEGAPSVLRVDQLQPGKYQPRTRMDEGALQELAASIRAQGLMQPILVRRVAEPDRYEIIAGERRYRASKLAGLDKVPVLVKDVADEAAAAMALIENIQREDLNPLEEAQGIMRLIREFRFTHEQAAESVGRSRSAVSNLLRLLNLAAPVQTMLMAGDLDMGMRARAAGRRWRQSDHAGQPDRQQAVVRARDREARGIDAQAVRSEVPQAEVGQCAMWRGSKKSFPIRWAWQCRSSSARVARASSRFTSPATTHWTVCSRACANRSQRLTCSIHSGNLFLAVAGMLSVSRDTHSAPADLRDYRTPSTRMTVVQSLTDPTSCAPVLAQSNYVSDRCAQYPPAIMKA
jgi:ParB/RepB/Spo0J family partition protein